MLKLKKINRKNVGEILKLIVGYLMKVIMI